MGIDAKKVRIGLADQTATTGALGRGPVIAAEDVPATLADVLTLVASYATSGYVSEEGATLTTDISTTDLVEWNRNTVRRLLDSFDGTVSLTLIQLDEEGAKQAFGAGAVTKVAATTTHGEQLRIAMGASLPEPQSWVLRMKDGDARMVVLVPNGQVTSGVEITFAASDAVQLPVTISANDDGTGHSIYLFTDDGVVAG